MSRLLLHGTAMQESRKLPRFRLVWLIITLIISIDNHQVHARSCVAVGNAEEQSPHQQQHQCTDDPLLLTRAINHKGEQSNRYNLGLAQRIDGTDAEKKAIVEVLMRMDDYFINEVLAHPEYSPIRTQCQNLNELCAFWVAVGECESNRMFMLSNCAAACRFCLLLNTDIR